MREYICMRCLGVFKLEELKQDAKRRSKGIIKNLRQCPAQKCGSILFYNKGELS